MTGARQAVIITPNGRAMAVLQDVESYERQRKSLQMLKLVLQGEQDYRRGAVVRDEDADRRFRAKLEALGGRD